MNYNTPLVSVIIPVYKVEKFIDQCIESVVKQTYDNLEIILVDDGSPDRCPEICDQWAKRDSRIRVIHKDNGGVSAARNIGMSAATGDFIYFIDSDDYIDHELIEYVVHYLITNSSEIVFFKYKIVDECGNEISTSAENYPDTGVYSSNEVLGFIWSGRIPNYPWGYCFRRSLVLHNKIEFPPNRIMGEDLSMMHLLINASNRISFISKELYFYRQRSGSTLSDKNLTIAESFFMSIKDVSDYSFFNYHDMLISQRNWAIKCSIAALIWAYRDRRNANYKDYSSFVSAASKYIDGLVNDIGFWHLSRAVLCEYLLIKFRMFSLINLFFSIHHRK